MSRRWGANLWPKVKILTVLGLYSHISALLPRAKLHVYRGNVSPLGAAKNAFLDHWLNAIKITIIICHSTTRSGNLINIEHRTSRENVISLPFRTVPAGQKHPSTTSLLPFFAGVLPELRLSQLGSIAGLHASYTWPWSHIIAVQ